jgi:hypothetical protein
MMQRKKLRKRLMLERKMNGLAQNQANLNQLMTGLNKSLSLSQSVMELQEIPTDLKISIIAKCILLKLKTQTLLP